MKIFILVIIMFIMTSVVHADSNVYIVQSGATLDLDITIDGNTNTVGQSGEKLYLTGANLGVDIDLIGAGNTIREFCTFNIGTTGGVGTTQIGNNNWLMAYVHIAHDCQLGNDIVLANNTSLAGHVEIDDFAILGGFTLVHQFCKLVAHIMTAVGTVIFKDVPPFIRAAGYNAKPNGINSEGLKRRNFTVECISNIKKAYKIIYREGNTLDSAKELLQILAKNSDEPGSNWVGLYIDFIDKSDRGLIR
jgi:UDP-N-acetylglucosamine acyltransferase